MLHAFLKKGSFQDSVSLMLISRDLSKADDVNRVSIMMGTPANKDVFRETGLWHDLLNDAGPNDICVVIDSDAGEEIVDQIRERMENASRISRRAGSPPRSRSCIPLSGLLKSSRRATSRSSVSPACTRMNPRCRL